MKELLNSVLNLNLDKTRIQVEDVVEDSISSGDTSTLVSKVNEVVESSLVKSKELQDSVYTQTKESWLTKNWRPVTMLAFTALLVLRWTGVANPDISQELELSLMNLIKIGLGGYVIGRSAEKITKELNNPESETAKTIQKVFK